MLKIASICVPSALHARPHPVFGITYGHLLECAALIELAIVASRLIGGSKPFALGLIVFGGNCLLYHTLVKVVGINEPCQCLGSLVSAVPEIAQYETPIAVTLAGSLLAGGLIIVRRSDGINAPLQQV
jgi:hypothetical protein